LRAKLLPGTDNLNQDLEEADEVKATEA